MWDIRRELLLSESKRDTKDNGKGSSFRLKILQIMDRVLCLYPSEKTHLRKLYLENVERRGHDGNSTVSQSSVPVMNLHLTVICHTLQQWGCSKPFSA